MDQKKELEQRLIEKATKDERFRKKLLSSPGIAIEQELGVKLPASLRINVLEENPGSIYLVIPFQTEAEQNDQLSESELETVAGGLNGWSADCDSGWFIPGGSGHEPGGGD